MTARHERRCTGAQVLLQAAIGAVGTLVVIWAGAGLMARYGDDVVGPSRRVIVQAGTVWPYALVGAGVIFVLRMTRGLLKVAAQRRDDPSRPRC